jgi:probable rRNA maturation factor
MSTTRAKAAVVVSNRQRALKLPAALVRRAALAALDYSGPLRGPVSVVIVGDARMRELNRRFARVDGTTDVLAFDLSEGPSAGDSVAGEVIVNAHIARTEAGRRRRSAVDELILYVIHGLLHLGGYEDHTAAERARMRAAERAVTRALESKPRGNAKCRRG